MQKAVFLDRDGTIIEDIGYLSETSQISILPGAVKELDIDINNSFMIGDKSSDSEAGRRAGCRTIVIGGGINHQQMEVLSQPADHIATDLWEAVKWLLH